MTYFVIPVVVALVYWVAKIKNDAEKRRILNRFSLRWRVRLG